LVSPSNRTAFKGFNAAAFLRLPYERDDPRLGQRDGQIRNGAEL